MNNLPPLPARVAKRIRAKAPDCPMIRLEVSNLSDFVAAFSSVLSPNEPFWFRGHAEYTWELKPSALRYTDPAKCEQALALVHEFKRFAEFKLDKPPGTTEEFKWWQLAQHYGLPTRLLDWTQSAAVALYFACQHEDKDGIVVVLNPADLNMTAARQRRVFDANADANLIAPYLNLGGAQRRNGKRTIAIHPTWNSERIIIQQGAFTLHGSRAFELDFAQAPSLCYLPILSKNKPTLTIELERIGISEMTIFPEPEHVCSYLKRHHKLT
jgi:hypothetical protein